MELLGRRADATLVHLTEEPVLIPNRCRYVCFTQSTRASERSPRRRTNTLRLKLPLAVLAIARSLARVTYLIFPLDW